ncbi:MAG TPA: dTMP kinase [Rubrobacteraceae bacterium]|nr:dTMP kinase [Rubrobacteraceae bacterium]
MKSDGLFITFEGGEGSGKSTQAQLLAEKLRHDGDEVLLTEEPRGTEFGLSVWEILARGVDPLSELFLFAASRAHHVRTLVEPALERGEVVVCDRFSDSTIAYQEFGRGLDRELVRRTCRYAEGGVEPALTFILDLDPAIGLTRKGETLEMDAIGTEALAFHKRVREGYRSLANEFPERIKTINADAAVEQIAIAVMATVSSYLAPG